VDETPNRSKHPDKRAASGMAASPTQAPFIGEDLGLAYDRMPSARAATFL